MYIAHEFTFSILNRLSITVHQVKRYGYTRPVVASYSPLILTSTETPDSAYFCRGKKMEENCSLRLQPFTFSHEIIQSSSIHQNNGQHFQATMIELLLFYFYPFIMISNLKIWTSVS